MRGLILILVDEGKSQRTKLILEEKSFDLGCPYQITLSKSKVKDFGKSVELRYLLHEIGEDTKDNLGKILGKYAHSANQGEIKDDQGDKVFVYAFNTNPKYSVNIITKGAQ